MKKFLHLLIPTGEVIKLGADAGGMAINHEGKPQQIFIDFENKKVRFNIPKSEEVTFETYDSYGVFYSESEEGINNILKSRQENKPPSPEEEKKSKTSIIKPAPGSPQEGKTSLTTNLINFPLKN